MARWEFKLPDIGEGVAEGEIVAWFVKPGDVVREDQPMVEVMTDKATVTIGAPRAGTVVETHGREGEVMAVHSVLVVFDLDGEAAEGRATTAKGENGHGAMNGTTAQSGGDGPAATAVGDIREDLPGMGTRVKPSPEESSPRYFNEKPLATPATRQMARTLNVDLKQVPPTGPQGRVTKQDVLAFSSGAPTLHPWTPLSFSRGEGRSSETSAAARGGAPSSLAREPVRIEPPSAAHEALEERVPFTGLRRKIAAKMVLSKHTAAHFTFVEECDVTALMALRTRFKVHAETLGVKLAFLPFIVKAASLALKRHPILNSALDESTNEIVYRRYYNIGIATSTDAGLLVPVVKDADKKSLLDLARDIDRLATLARAGKAKPEDLAGSTFTITSLGAQGGLLATPILNFPEVGSLGVHRMRERPVVKEGRIVIGHVMLLSLSFDHRVVDGQVGAAFAYDLIGYLEDPDKLLLETM
jgi:pyruvate dehydrogenase E2 component (dihydrolipoamide acetyltransferase)